MKYMKKWLVLFIAFSLLIPMSVHKGIANPTDNAEKLFDIRIDIPGESAVSEIRKSGVTIVEEYPSYVYAKANEKQFRGLIDNSFLAVRLPDMDAVFVAGRSIYPQKDEEKSFFTYDIPQGLQASDLFDSPNRYYLVKFKGPAKEDWIKDIHFAGGEIVEHYNYNAVVVRIGKSKEGELRQFDFISAMTEYAPSFKMPYNYAIKDETVFAFALVWKGVDLGMLKVQLEEKAQAMVISEMEMEDFSIVVIYLNKTNVFEAAKIPDIQYLEFPPDAFKFKSDVSRDIIGLHFIEQGYGWQSSFPGQTDPGPRTRPQNVNTGANVTLNGSGEIVAVFDSGLDRGVFAEQDLLEDFRGGALLPVAYHYSQVKPGSGVPGNSYGNSYAVRYFAFGFDYSAARRQTPQTAQTFSDIWGHGTVVAGIIAGRGRAGDNRRYRGVAPAARLLIQKITPPWSRDDYTPPPQNTAVPPPRLEKPAKAHPNLARPALWDLGGPDGVNERWYPHDEVPYKYDLDPVPGPDLPPDNQPEAYISFHDVPQVAGEVYGPEFGGMWTPEDGAPNRPPYAPNYAGAAGAFFYALVDAYNDGARIMNNSWWWYYLRTRQGYIPDPGSPRFSTYDYNMISKMTDSFQYTHQTFLTVWAAGDNGRDRNLDGITDIGQNLNDDYTFGDPWVEGENQQFFAPAALKNGITVGATENYRPTIRLFYGAAGSGLPRANYGLFLRTDQHLPSYGDFIASDKVADGNRPPNLKENEFDKAYLNPTDGIGNYYKDMTKWLNPPAPPNPAPPDYLKQTDGKFAMWALSTRGPSSDGRIKPDLVAPGSMIIGPQSQYVGNSAGSNPAYPFEYGYPSPAGGYVYMSGTSMSAAFVSGAAALVRQFYRQVHDVDKQGVPSPSSSLIKATLIHGATNMAANQYPNQYDVIEDANRIVKTKNDVTARPDFNQGWGRLNVFKSLFPLAPKVQRWDDNTIGLDDSAIEYKIIVDRTDVPFEATLVWNDKSANPNTWPVLVYDMDLLVQEPGQKGKIYRGNQFGNPELNQDPNFSIPNPPSTDSLNNVERVVIAEPIKGEYTIRVIPANFPKAIGRQPVPYSLVYSGGFRDVPVEHPIPVMNHLSLGLLAVLLLFAGVFGIRKGLKVVKAS